MKRINFTHIFLSALLTIVLVAVSGQAEAQSRKQYQFKAPPSGETNRLYRVNIYTGEMAMCWYSKPVGSERGITDCRRAGPGAGPQKRGLYRLEASNVPSELGIFRVNELTGEMSICWHSKKTGTVTCTEQAR